MKIVDCKQGTEEWWQARMGVPTASEFHRIITAKKWEYAAGAQSYIHELVADRLWPSWEGFDDCVSAAVRNGKMMEPEARRYYEFEHGVQTVECGFMTTDDGRFGYSPDSLVDEDGLLECKCPMRKTQVKWLDAGVVPGEHLAQCHGGLIVSGRAWVDFISYCHGLPTLLVRVTPDEKTEALRVALERFWGEFETMLARIKARCSPLPTREVATPVGSYTEEIYQESYW